MVSMVVWLTLSSKFLNDRDALINDMVTLHCRGYPYGLGFPTFDLLFFHTHVPHAMQV